MGTVFELHLVDQVQWKFKLVNHKTNIYVFFDVSDQEAKRFRSAYSVAKRTLSTLPPDSEDLAGQIIIAEEGVDLRVYSNRKPKLSGEGDLPFVSFYVQQGKEFTGFYIQAGNRNAFERLLEVTNQ